jgi:hypothetical protein
MIPALGAGGHEFDSRSGPLFLTFCLKFRKQYLGLAMFLSTLMSFGPPAVGMLKV